MSKQRDKVLCKCQLFAKSKGLPCAAEYRFHPIRKWRFDLAIVPLKIAIEYEGIAGSKWSRHTSLTGYTGDADKYNEAQLHGWIVLRFTALNCKDALEILERAISLRTNTHQTNAKSEPGR